MQDNLVKRRMNLLRFLFVSIKKCPFGFKFLTQFSNISNICNEILRCRKLTKETNLKLDSTQRFVTLKFHSFIVTFIDCYREGPAESGVLGFGRKPPMGSMK